MTVTHSQAAKRTASFYRIACAMLMGLLVAAGGSILSAPAASAAVDSRCTVIPALPTKASNSFFQTRSSINCGEWFLADNVRTTLQRQATVGWVELGSYTTTTTTSGSKVLVASGQVGNCNNGTSTYRNRAIAVTKGGGTSTVFSTGRSLACQV